MGNFKNFRLLVGFLFFASLLLLQFSNCTRPGLSSKNQIDLNSSIPGQNGDLLPNEIKNPGSSHGDAQPSSVAMNYFGNNNDWPMDSECFTKAVYDACLIWKSPVAHQYYLSKDNYKSIFYDTNQQPNIMTSGTDLTSITTLSVNVTKWIFPAGSSSLKSDLVEVYASNGRTNPANFFRTAAINGNFKFQYQTDTQFNVAQVSAFYWINYARDFFKARGADYFSARSMPEKPILPVDVYNPSVLDNGYFTANPTSSTRDRWGKVVLGKVSDPNSGRSHELALSAEVYLHEMGHANLYYAMGGPGNPAVFSDYNHYEIKTTNGSTTYVCATADGCYFALNEGQADFHSHVLFEQQPYLLEQLSNLATGPEDRNALLLGTKSAREVFDSSGVRERWTNRFFGGQIHGLGALYGAILYKIYTHKDVDKIRFLKVFTTHLTFIDSYSTFRTAKQDLLDADRAVPGKSQAAIINAEFEARGL